MITNEMVKNMAVISKISIDDDEATKFSKDLNNMFRFIDMIEEIEILDNVEEFCDFEHKKTTDFFRDDIVFESLKREDILGNSSYTEDGYFVV